MVPVQLDDILPIVRQHAKHIAGKWPDTVIDAEDLYQEGAIMALHIIQQGVPDQPVEKTYSYLHQRIAGRMRDALRLSQGRCIDKRTVEIDALEHVGLDSPHGHRKPYNDLYELINRFVIDHDQPEEIAIAEEGLKRTVRRLKPREREILEAVMEGYRNTEIAKRYGVTLSAISHVLHENIIPKLAL